MLPPISTTGLSAADVGTLSTRVRDQMVDTLRDISGKLDSKNQSEGSHFRQDAPRDAPSDSPLESTIPTTLSPVIGVELESSETKLDVDETSASSSTSSSRRRTLDGSEAGTETEEDEGMILVGRPT